MQCIKLNLRVFRHGVCCLLVVFGVTVVGPGVALARGYRVSARAAIFSNSTKMVRYYGKHVYSRVRPASTTKVMTALLVMEHLPLDKVVTVRADATHVPPTKLYVRPGEKYTVRNLLYALLLRSANDVSIVLADAVAGSQEKFTEMMNRKARELGARRTRFVNTNGLPSRHGEDYTTAYDMYLIFRAALKYPFFREVISHGYKTISSLEGRKIRLKNHNDILFSHWKRKIFGKTGYTRRARECFVGYLMKGHDVCIIAVFGCTHRWRDIKYIVEKYGHIDL